MDVAARSKGRVREAAYGRGVVDCEGRYWDAPARLAAVQSIRPADEGVTRDQPTGMPSGARTDAPDVARTRTVNTSEGDGAR